MSVSAFHAASASRSAPAAVVSYPVLSVSLAKGAEALLDALWIYRQRERFLSSQIHHSVTAAFKVDIRQHRLRLENDPVVVDAHVYAV